MKYLYKQTPNGYKNNAIIKNKPERVQNVRKHLTLNPNGYKIKI